MAGGAGRVASPSYTSTFLCNATRLAVTTLSVADVQVGIGPALVLPGREARPPCLLLSLPDFNGMHHGHGRPWLR